MSSWLALFPLYNILHSRCNFFISSKINTVILTETLFRCSNFLPVYSAASISVFGIHGKLNNRSLAQTNCIQTDDNIREVPRSVSSRMSCHQTINLGAHVDLAVTWCWERCCLHSVPQSVCIPKHSKCWIEHFNFLGLLSSFFPLFCVYTHISCMLEG